ncbi:MAG: putative alpha/beta-hydrolase family hydrolase [Kiritimatiellia bacterium]|jgi:predicted alpha/beta-hydrolase family hydrolase
MLLWQGPATSSFLVVLAPGDMGLATDAAPAAIAHGFAKAGLLVVRFDCPSPTATPDASLAVQIRDAAAAREPHQRLVLAGLSRGARVSATLIEELGAVGLVGFAYPFHPRHDPDPGDRVRQLCRVPVPALICQGTRDSHGNQQQVRGYNLPAHVAVHWLFDANHALRPRARSGCTQESQLAQAAQVAATFIQQLA